MTYDDGTIQAAATELYDEHRSLDALLRTLAHTTERNKLGGLLDGLHAQLYTHIQHEELPGGLYARLGALGETNEAEVRTLVDEHFRMLSAVRGMAVRVKHDDEPLAVFQAEIARLITWIEDHETREHRLAKAATA